MKTARRLTTATMFFAALAFVPAVWAAEPPVGSEAAAVAEPVLKAIPHDALGFVLVKNLAQTDKAISKLAAKVQAPVPSVLSAAKLQAEGHEGLDESGSAAVALLSDKSADAEKQVAGAKPAVVPVFFLPVSDYKKFIGQFKPDDATAEITGVTVAGHSLLVGRKDSFAVFTLPNHKDQLAKVLASTKGVDSVLEPFKPWLGRQQISLYASPSGAKMALEAALVGLKKAQTAVKRLPAEQSAQFGMQLKLYETILSKAAEQVEAFAAGLALDENSNLSIDSRTTFSAGGSWEASIKDLKPGGGNPFAGLQQAPYIVAGEGVLPESWGQALAAFSAQSMSNMSQVGGGAALSGEQRKQYVEAMESLMKGLHSASFVMQTTTPGEGMYDGAVDLMKVDDAKAYLAQYQKSLEEMQQATKAQEKPMFRFTDVKKIEIDGKPGLSVTFDMSGMLAEKNGPEAKVLPLVLGKSGKLTARIIVADEHTLLAAYGSEAHAKESLAAFKNPKTDFAADPDVAATLKLLPPHAQWIGLVSVKGYLGLIGNIMSQVGVPFKLPELPTMPPIGFAAEAGSHGLDTQLVLPAETLAGISQAIHGATGNKR